MRAGSADYLRGIRSQAKDLGIEIQAGTGRIDRTSGFLERQVGPAREAAAHDDPGRRSARVAVARCYLGWIGDRAPKVGLWPHIAPE